jgi:hypothetical protein
VASIPRPPSGADLTHVTDAAIYDTKPYDDHKASPEKNKTLRRPGDCTGSGLRREKVVVPPITAIERVDVFAIGHYALRFETPHLQSLTFAAIIFGSEASVYLLRERALLGVASQPRDGLEHVDGAERNRIHHAGRLPSSISPQLFAAVAAIAVIYFFTLDWFKVWLFARLQLR